MACSRVTTLPDGVLLVWRWEALFPGKRNDLVSKELGNREHQVTEIQHWRRVSNSEHLPFKNFRGS